MKYCQNCGMQVNENVKFCPKCGAPQQIYNDQYNNQPQYAQQPYYVQPSPSVFQGQQYNQEPQNKVPETPKKKTGCLSIVLWVLFLPIMLWIHAFRKKQVGWYVLAAIVTMIVILGSITSNNSNSNISRSKNSTLDTSIQSESTLSSLSGFTSNQKPTKTPKPTNTPKPTKTPTLTPTAITYTSITVKTLIDDLSSNAARAKLLYEGNYYEITGYVSNIDASGKYITLDPSNDPWDFNLTSVQIFVKNENQKQSLINFTKGQRVVIKAKCTRVGELLGYSFDWQ